MEFNSRAPARIDFLGGGSDCPPFSSDFTGAVLNAGITRYINATVRVGGSEVLIISKDLDISISAPDVNSLPENTGLDLLVGCAKRANLQTSFSLTTESDLPPQSGLGASGAIAVAALAALLYASGNNLSPTELANLAFGVERKDLGYPGGSQDQYGSALGGFNYLTFHDPVVNTDQLAGRYAPLPHPLNHEIISELESRLLLVYTGKPHFSPNIHADIYSSYCQANSPTKNALHHLKRLADKGRKTLLEGNLNQFAQLLNENWKWHKDLHPSCTNDELEKVYEIALQNGAIGGKTCGAGGGGCVVFLCEESTKEEVSHALQTVKISELQILDFSFDLCGVEVWRENIPA